MDADNIRLESLTYERDDTMSVSEQRRGIAWFLFLAFGFSWLLWSPVWTARIPLRSGLGIFLAAVGMWGPGLNALIVTRWVLGETWRTTTLDRLGRRQYYLWAWLLPAAGTAIAALLTVAFGAASLDPELHGMRGVMASQGFDPPWMFVILGTLGGIALAPVLNAPFAVGEEIGWRGFLVPRLLQLGLRPWPASMICGVIWGLWHAPLILQGHNYPDHPFLGVALMTGFTTLLGIIFGWLQLASGSVWVPTAAHGALNGIAALPIILLTPHDAAFGGTLASLTGWIPIAAFVVWLALRGESGRGTGLWSAATRRRFHFRQEDEGTGRWTTRSCSCPPFSCQENEAAPGRCTP